MSALPPGPWHAEPHGQHAEMWGVYAPDRDPNSENDGVVCIADYLSEDVARLVAAAPDLLAALKELVGQLERMRAAIALAEGKP